MRALTKYLLAASRPAFWPALVRRVMPTVEHMAALKSFEAKTVLDVGANRGQFSIAARHVFPSAHIYAFEPLESARDCYRSVVTEPSRMHPFALGATKGSQTFFVTSRSDSSSLFLPGDGQRQAYGVGLSSTIIVPVERLDDVVKPAELVSPVLLKLDVQGAEIDVLKGATKLLFQIDAIYCEVSFVELYHQQPIASEIVSFLYDYGFSLRGVFNTSHTKRFGPTQADMLFFRNGRGGGKSP